MMMSWGLCSVMEARKALPIAGTSAPEMVFVADLHVGHWRQLWETVRCAQFAVCLYQRERTTTVSRS